MSTENFIRSPCFDFNEIDCKFEFKEPTAKIQKEFNAQPSLISPMKCKSLSSNQTKKGVFALYGQWIAYYGSKYGRSKSPKMVLNITFARLQLSISSNEDFVFMISKNGNSFEFQLNDKEAKKSWITALKSVCVLTDFHGQYKPIKMIGKGSFAQVYLAESKENGNSYAVKSFFKNEIISSLSKYPQSPLLNEIDIMRNINHDNIIKLHEVYESVNSIYLVMELVEGKPLQDILEKPSFLKDYSENRIMKMIKEILDALSYLASKGIMHRDLKPDNILVDKNGKIKIVDFGLATYVELPEYIYKKCGSPGYIAPEMFEYDEKFYETFYNDRVDVFSAGCILFYMLFGYPLFDANGGTDILELNRDFDEKNKCGKIKNELNSISSKINKQGLKLLLELLEFDKKKRISASDALCHPYFASSNIPCSIKLPSSKEISILSPLVSTLILKRATSNALSPLRFNENHLSENSKGEFSPQSPYNDKFIQKESMYLDVGKADMNGKLDTVSNASEINSMFSIRLGNASPTPASPSSFSKKGLLQAQKARGQSKSFKGSKTPTKGQDMRKAAICNNLHKNNIIDEEEGKKEECFERKQERRYSEGYSGPVSSFTAQMNKFNDMVNNSSHTQSSNAWADEEIGDVGEESERLETNLERFEHYILNPNPGKIFQVE